MQTRSMSEIVHSRRPVCLPPDATVREAARLMKEHRIGAVLVTEGEMLRGIFTGRDALTRVLAEGRSGNTRLDQVMTPGPETLNDRHTAIEALRLMRDGGFRHVPVCQEGRLTGIVSVGDFKVSEHARLDEETGYWEIL